MVGSGGADTRAEATDGATVRFGTVSRTVAPSEELTFGRAEACDVCLDGEDRGISRCAGAIEQRDGTWWVVNRSTVRPLTVVDDLGIRTLVAPERRLALTGPVTVVVDGSNRRHAIEVEPPPRDEPARAPRGLDDAQPTETAAEVTIGEPDRLALVALLAGYLEAFPRYDPHPRSYADAAAALGWPRTTLVKRIEYLRVRLTGVGVPNLVGDTALEGLAEWALTTRVVTREDLALLRRG